MTMLRSVDRKDVISEPFPYVVIKDALDEGLCERLRRGFPDISIVSEGASYVSNERFSYPASKSLKNARIDEEWKRVVLEHVGQEFLDDVVRVFGREILRVHPEFERIVGPMDRLRAGVRNRDNFDRADVLLDAQICVNTPVNGNPDSVRVAHIDAPDKLFAGLLYLRDPDDHSVGGDLEIYRYLREDHEFFQGQHVESKYIERVAKVPYQNNALVFFINSERSLHGVSVREKTDSVRKFLNVVGEVKSPLFDIHARQEGRLKRFLRRRNLFYKTIRY